MQIESIKCPNCGGNLSISPNMKQVYCKYCSSLLVVDNNPQSNGYERNDGSDNPISIEVIKVDAEPVKYSILSDKDRFMKVLAGISFLRNSSIPFKIEDEIWWEIYSQEVKKTIFGEKRGEWKLIEDQNPAAGHSLYDKYDIIRNKKESEPIENISFSKSDFGRKNECYIKRIKHEVKYDARILPDSIKRHNDYYSIINNSKSNKHIQSLLSDIINAVPDDPSVKGFWIEVKMNRINLNISFMPSIEYHFHAYGLSDCASNEHRFAMLSIIAGEALNRIGDRYALELIDTRLDDDGIGAYDYCCCQFKHLTIISKTYQDW